MQDSKVYVVPLDKDSQNWVIAQVPKLNFGHKLFRAIKLEETATCALLTVQVPTSGLTAIDLADADNWGAIEDTDNNLKEGTTYFVKKERKDAIFSVVSFAATKDTVAQLRQADGSIGRAAGKFKLAGSFVNVYHHLNLLASIAPESISYNYEP